jgi:Ketopantoate reductase PanE/ApbA
VKVLIIGRGVVGTIYGWALSKAGIDVTHVVRKEGLPGTDTLHLLDLRPGYPKNTRVTYAPKAVGQISPSDGFTSWAGLPGLWTANRLSAGRFGLDPDLQRIYTGCNGRPVRSPWPGL